MAKRRSGFDSLYELVIAAAWAALAVEFILDENWHFVAVSAVVSVQHLAISIWKAISIWNQISG